MHMKEEKEQPAPPEEPQPKEDDRLMRLAADFENYKKRVARDSADASIAGKREILLKLLSLADTFELAMLSIRSASPEVLKGMLMIQSQLRAFLTEEGAAPFGAEGEKFDPFRHDALEFEPGGEHGTIASVIQKGYIFKGSILRHAVVRVYGDAGPDKKGEENRSEKKDG